MVRLLTEREDGAYRLSRIARAAVWLFVLATMVSALLIVLERFAAQRAYEGRSVEYHRLRVLADARHTSAVRLYRETGRFHPISKPQVEEAVCGKQPLDLQPTGDGRERGVWTDPETGLQLELTFTEGRWTGCERLRNTEQIVGSGPWAKPRVRWWLSGMQELCIRDGGARRFPWVMLFTIAIAWARYRPALAELSLAALLFVTTLWLADPRYDTSWVALGRHATEGPWLLWIGAAGLSVAAMAMPVIVQRKPKPWCCRGCGYDLTGNVSGVCPECGLTIG